MSCFYFRDMRFSSSRGNIQYCIECKNFSSNGVRLQWTVEVLRNKPTKIPVPHFDT